MHPWAQRGDAVGPASGLRPSQVCACPFPSVPRSSKLGAQQSRQTGRLRSPRSPLATVGACRATLWVCPGEGSLLRLGQKQVLWKFQDQPSNCG